MRREAILIVPNDLPSVFHAEFIEINLQKAKIVVNSINEKIPVVGQNTLAFGEPGSAPIPPFTVMNPLFVISKFRTEVVRRIGNYKLCAGIGELFQFNYTVSIDDLISIVLLHLPLSHFENSECTDGEGLERKPLGSRMETRACVTDREL